jgi:hypothetical protein
MDPSQLLVNPYDSTRSKQFARFYVYPWELNEAAQWIQPFDSCAVTARKDDALLLFKPPSST